MLKRIFSWSLLVAYSGFVIHSAVVIPTYLPPAFFELNDKVAHAAQYGLLVLIAFNALRWHVKQALFLAIIYSLSIGALTEWLQSFSDYRNADILDWLADAIGVAIGVALLLICSKMKPRFRGDS